MPWWIWALIIWASLASAVVVLLAVALSMHVEWREATLAELEGRPRPETFDAQVQAALLRFLHAYRRVTSGASTVTLPRVAEPPQPPAGA